MLLILSTKISLEGNKGFNSCHLSRTGDVDVKEAMIEVFRDVQTKKSTMTMSKLKELLFRCAAALVHKHDVSDLRSPIITLRRLKFLDCRQTMTCYTTLSLCPSRFLAYL